MSVVLLAGRYAVGIDYLRCGWLAGGFARFRCEGCGLDRLVAFSCKGRGFCPSCGGGRIVERAAHLVEHVFPAVPVRQWVFSFPPRVRYAVAWDHELCREVVGIARRAGGDGGAERGDARAGSGALATGSSRLVGSMRWPDLMRRAFEFDVLACPRCGGRLRLLAPVEQAAVVERILRHLDLPTAVPQARPARAPPLAGAALATQATDPSAAGLNGDLDC